MKAVKRLLILFIWLPIAGLHAQENVKQVFLEKWEHSKTYLLEMAQNMPESAYSFKPTKNSMSFAEQLLHIRKNMLWLSSTYLGGEPWELAANNQQDQSKEAIIKLLESAFEQTGRAVSTCPAESFNTKVDFFAGEKSRLQILNLIQDHVTHHRGQLIVYLALNNIDRPEYTGW
ncbi:DinB family protein [Robertkochia aurantiaca]|uniref:DinB family protein n=1 Tax=Robertkochia aurantiaca TaxID=2873700 RepID=UPI001CCE857E|nr:DinB family protein [Robertkochia sp. 3YJGBD-33]